MINGLFLVRFGFAALCLLALALMVWKHRETVAGLNKFMFEPTSALNLGLLRIAIFYLLFRCSFTNPASWFASLSPSFVNLPRGWAWLEDVYPVALRYIRPAELAFIVFSGLALVGLFTRVSTILASLLAVWVMGVPQFYFKIGHDMHAVVLSALVLACSPCGHGLSVDALIRRLRGIAPPERSASYTVPIRFSWMLLGTGYLFPGLWKLWESGDLWISGRKLQVELFSKWAQLPDYTPAARIDHYPLVLIFFGAMTLVFEIGFFPALFSRRTRAIAGLVATSFHLGVGMAMDIWFSLWLPLIVLFDLPELLQVAPFSWFAKPVTSAWARLGALGKRLLPHLATPAATILLPRAPAAAFVAGSVLVLAMFAAGLGPIDSWPIAVYPRFSDRTSGLTKTSFGLQFVAQLPSGEERELQIQFRPFEDSAGVFRIVRAAISLKGKGRTAALDEHVALIARVVKENSPPLPAGTRLFIYRFDFHVDPAERAGDKRRRSLIAETPL